MTESADYDPADPPAMRAPLEADDAAALADALPTPIWQIDRSNRLIWTNPAGADLAAGQALPAALEDLPGAVGIGEDRGACEAAFGGRAQRWEGWVHRPGAPRSYEIREFLPWRAADGQVLGVFVTFTDQTALRTVSPSAQQYERLLQDAIESTPDGVGIENAEGTLIVCNARYADNYGAKREDLIGLRFEDRMVHLKRRIVSVERAEVEDPTEAEVAGLVDMRRRTADPVEMSLIDGTDLLVKRANTSEGGRVIVTTDITELRRRERESAETRHLLEDAVEAVGFGVAIYDADGGLLVWNSRFAAVCGASTVERGQTWAAILDRAVRTGRIRPDAAGPEGYAARIDAATSDPSEEVDLETDDGQKIAAWRCPTRSGGQVLTLRDVTEKRRAEAQLRESWEMARDILEACPAPITMSRTSDGEIIYENPAAKAVMRSPEPDSPRRIETRWIDPADRDVFIAQTRAGRGPEGFERPFYREDGDVVWLSLRANVTTHKDDEVFVIAIEDMTERRAREAELTRQREMRHQAEKLGALGEVLAGISHELNNPLSVLVGQAALLTETAPDDAVRARAARISEAADRCARIVRSFLAMARQGPAEKVDLWLDDVVRAALELAEPELSMTKTKAVENLTGGAVRISGDLDQLRQVVLNLLINASQAMAGTPKPHEIHIDTGVARGATRAEDRAWIIVRDTGPGIPEDHASRVFDPLFTTKSGGVGAGIGLALCHRIVTGHGGKIELMPQAPEGGAAFRIELPLANPKAEIDDASEPDADPDARTVLVIDDDEEVLQTTQDLLRLCGHKAWGASSAREGLKMLARHRPDIVISDIRMPDMDGFDLLDALQADHPDLVERLIFATGDTLSPRVARALKRSGRPCLEKPFLLGDLKAIIADIAND